jgi:hypothetical protein
MQAVHLREKQAVVFHVKAADFTAGVPGAFFKNFQHQGVETGSHFSW